MSLAKPFEIPKQSVWAAWLQVKANHGAHGIDGQTIEAFEDRLGQNLYRLWNRMSSGSYFPPPVRAVEIPKGNGKTRLLGIPTVADRVAQAVVRNNLEVQVEPCFHEDSYAYRPSKSALDAIAMVRRRCWKYDWVLEFDIKGAFDHIDHDLMMKALRHHTRCPWVALYVERWLKAPMVKGQEITERVCGTPQGGVVSPLLFNLYMHYAFDAWMAKHFPAMPFVRYADDDVIHCKGEAGARQVQEAVGARLKACGLELHPEKTRIVYCRDGNRKADYPQTSFDFLGYTFRGRLAKSVRGVYFNSFSPALSGKAAKRIRAQMRKWRISRWTEAGIEEIAERVNPTLRGWWNYYAAFYVSVFKRVVGHLNDILAKWAVRKFRRLKRSRGRARNWLRQLARRAPDLLYHWKQGALPSAG
jgi:group II intron reverse transcriptase/maturase